MIIGLFRIRIGISMEYIKRVLPLSSATAIRWFRSEATMTREVYLKHGAKTVVLVSYCCARKAKACFGMRWSHEGDLSSMTNSWAPANQKPMRAGMTADPRLIQKMASSSSLILKTWVGSSNCSVLNVWYPHRVSIITVTHKQQNCTETLSTDKRLFVCWTNGF